MGSRQTFSWRLCQLVVRGVMLLVLSLAALGCQREPGPPALLGFDPPSPAAHAGASIYIRLTYDAKGARLGNFSWTVEAGSIIGDGLSAVIYQAPPTPGTHRVSVAVAYGSQGKTASLAGTIQVLPAPAPVAKAPHAPPAIDAAPRAATSSEKPAPETRPMIERIVQQGRFRAVVYHDFAPFSFVDAHGNRVGFDIDLMRECARRWVGDANAVTFIPVEAGRRISTLLEGKADIIAAALTKTPNRQQEIAFSHTYFQDGQRLLVPEHAEVSDVCDLKGKKIALTSGSTAVVNVKAQLDRCGVAAELVSVDAHTHGVEAVLTGAADAFSTDGLALEQWAQGRPLKVVGNHFSEEPYGLGLRKGEDDLLRLLNLTLEVMYADGTLAALYRKWFADSLRPYPIPSIVTSTAEPALLHLARTELPALFPPIREPDPFAKDYTVQRGDTLSHLAGKFYGDVSPGSWQRIYAANQEVIGPHPSRLRIGMRLRIPPP